MAKTEVGIVFKAYDETSRNLDKIGLSLGKLGGTLRTTAAAVGIGLSLDFGIRQVKSWINAAKEADKVQRTFELALGDNADAAGRWADEYANAAGVCEIETRKLLTSQEMLGEELGLSAEQALQTAKTLARLADDVASFTRNAFSAPEVLQKFQLALGGSYRGLQSLGIKINEVIVKEYALREGWIKEGQELSRAQQAAAAFNLIMEHSAKIHGDLARSAGSATDQERRLKVGWQDLKREWGEQLMPTYTAGLKELHKNLSEHKDDLRDIVGLLISAGNAVVHGGLTVAQAAGEAGKEVGYRVRWTGPGMEAWARGLGTMGSRGLRAGGGSVPNFSLMDQWDIATLLGAPATGPSAAGAGAAPAYGPLAGTGDYGRLGDPGRDRAAILQDSLEEAKELAQEMQRYFADEKAAYRDVYGEIDQRTEASFTYRRKLLEEEYTRYAEFISDKNVLDQWYAEQARKLDIERSLASEDFVAGFRGGVMQMEDDLQTLGQLGADAAKMTRDAWVSGSWDMITATEDLDDAARNLLLDLGRIGYTWAMNQAFTRTMGWLIGAGSALPTGGVNPQLAPTVAPPVYPAHRLGEAFENGRVSRFGWGEIVREPTLFPLRRGLGLMGEAGPEGILPLGRTAGGQLGVHVAERDSNQITDMLLRQLIGAVREGQRLYLVDDTGAVQRELRRLTNTRSVLMR